MEAVARPKASDNYSTALWAVNLDYPYIFLLLFLNPFFIVRRHSTLVCGSQTNTLLQRQRLHMRNRLDHFRFIYVRTDHPVYILDI
jgi:hypothetical protein